MKFTALVLALGFAVSAALADTEYPPRNPGKAETVQIRSETCLGLGTQSQVNCRPQTVSAWLFRPQTATQHLVLVSHGAQGPDQRVFEYAEAIVQQGWAALVIDSWQSRGVDHRRQRYAESWRLGGTTVSQALDMAWASHQFHSEFPRITALGESMGGMALIQLQRERIRGHFPEGIPIDRMVAQYPGCVEQRPGERFASTPLLIIAGERDTHTLSRHCRDYTDYSRQRGAQTQFQEIKGAAHDWDAAHALEFRSRAENISGCRIDIYPEEIHLVDQNLRVPNTLEGQVQVARTCVRPGVWSGHQGQRFQAYPLWLAYLAE